MTYVSEEQKQKGKKKRKEKLKASLTQKAEGKSSLCVSKPQTTPERA